MFIKKLYYVITKICQNECDKYLYEDGLKFLHYKVRDLESLIDLTYKAFL